MCGLFDAIRAVFGRRQRRGRRVPRFGNRSGGLGGRGGGGGGGLAYVPPFEPSGAMTPYSVGDDHPPEGLGARPFGSGMTRSQPWEYPRRHSTGNAMHVNNAWYDGPESNRRKTYNSDVSPAAYERPVRSQRPPQSKLTPPARGHRATPESVDQFNTIPPRAEQVAPISKRIYCRSAKRPPQVAHQNSPAWDPKGKLPAPPGPAWLPPAVPGPSSQAPAKKHPRSASEATLRAGKPRQPSQQQHKLPRSTSEVAPHASKSRPSHQKQIYQSWSTFEVNPRPVKYWVPPEQQKHHRSTSEAAPRAGQSRQPPQKQHKHHRSTSEAAPRAAKPQQSTQKQTRVESVSFLPARMGPRPPRQRPTFLHMTNLLDGWETPRHTRRSAPL